MADEEAPRSEIKVLVSLTESNIMTELQDSVKKFTDALTGLTGTVQEIKDAAQASVGGGGGGGRTRVRAPGTEGGSSGGGSQFVPFSFWGDEIRGRQNDMASDIMRRGFEMPRFGNWSAQDYLVHGGYIGQRMGFRQGMDTETGQRDYMLGGPGAEGPLGKLAPRPMGVEEFVDQHMPALEAAVNRDFDINKISGEQAQFFEQTGALQRDEDGNWIGDRASLRTAAMGSAARTGALAGAGRRAGGALMGAARMAPLVSTGINSLQFLRALPGRLAMPTREGMAMGLDRGGGGDAGFIPFMDLFGNAASNETFAGLRDAFTASLPSWLGGSGGFLGFGEGQEINQAIHSQGYSRGDRERMFDVMADMRSNRGLDIGVMAQQIDAAVRHGGTSLEAFRGALEAIPDAAQAARMSVQAYQESLHQAAQTAAQRGQTYGAATSQIEAITTATGYQPDVAASMLGNTNLTAIAASRMGMGYGELLDNPRARAQGAVMAPAMMFQIVAGRPLDRAAVRDPQTRQNIRTLYDQGMGESTFGVSFEQLMTMGITGQDAMAESGAASGELHDILDAELGDITLRGGETLNYGNINDPKNRERLDKRVRTLVDSAVPAADREKNKEYQGFMDDLSSGKFKDDPREELNRAIAIIAEDTRTKTINDQAVTGIALKGYAEEILKTVITNQENGVASSARTADRTNNGTRKGGRYTGR